MSKTLKDMDSVEKPAPKKKAKGLPKRAGKSKSGYRARIRTKSPKIEAVVVPWVSVGSSGSIRLTAADVVGKATHYRAAVR